jgi:beta-galactosidase
VTGNGFLVRFDKKTGTIDRLVQDGTNLLAAGGAPLLHLWRASHRNDDNWAYRAWDKFGVNALQYKLVDFKAEAVDNTTVKIISTTRADGKEGFGVIHTVHYLISGDGTVKADNEVQFLGLRINLARIGVRMMLDKRLDRMTYYGRGPTENYADRKSSADVGLYTLGVNEQYEYEKPMERGNHEEVRWAVMSGEGMPRLEVRADEHLMQVSALPHTDEQMHPVEYKIDLPASTATVFCMSTRTLGVGSASCGPKPLPRYLVWSDNARFSYTLQLLPGGKTK